MSRRTSTYDDDACLAAVARAPSDRQDRYMRKAAQCAARSNMVQRHGCVIVDRVSGYVVANGYNKKTAMFSTNDKEAKYSVHAEIDALSKLRKTTDVANLEMYVVRIGSSSLCDGSPFKLSMPCCSCSQVIKKISIRKVYYSTTRVYTGPQ
jgi:deoxycytidylate deaminase